MFDNECRKGTTNENQRHIIRKTKVLSKIDENGYEQRELVTEDVNLITGEVKVIETKHYDWRETHEH